MVTIIRRLGAAIATPKKIFHFCSHQIVRQLGRRWHWTSWRCRRNTTNTYRKKRSRVKAEGCQLHNCETKNCPFSAFWNSTVSPPDKPCEMSSTTRRRIALSSGLCSCAAGFGCRRQRRHSSRVGARNSAASADFSLAHHLCSSSKGLPEGQGREEGGREGAL